MRTFLYALGAATGLLILIIFFQNLSTATSSIVMVLSQQMSVKSGTIVFFSSICGAIAAGFTFYGVYFDQIFGKKESVWSGNQKEDLTKGQKQDDWENTEW